MPAARTKRISTVKEPPADFEVAGQYLPVHDKAAALEQIFSLS